MLENANWIQQAYLSLQTRFTECETNIVHHFG